jgi:hypothetical protein
MQSPVSDSLWLCHVHWPDDCPGLRNQPGKNTRQQKNPDTATANVRRMAPGGPTDIKKLPVKSDVPEYLVNKSGHRIATALNQAVADLTTIAFYYLLRVGKYTVKQNKNKTKRTVQLKMEDITFFRKDKLGRIMCLARAALLADILTADGATLKLDNQKNGHKGVCVYQQTTGDPIHCPVRALGWLYQHLRENKATGKTFICAYWMDNEAYNVMADDISAA